MAATAVLLASLSIGASAASAHSSSSGSSSGNHYGWSHHHHSWGWGWGHSESNGEGHEHHGCTPAPPTPKPTAAFTYAPASPIAGDVASFDASGSIGSDVEDVESAIVEYAWNFGDESSSTGEAAATEHTFTTGGSFEVTLTVKNADGESDSATQTVAVEPPLLPLPTAAFTLNPVAPVAERIVYFDAGTSTGGLDRSANGSIVAYDWNFGDGAVETGTVPTSSHAFAAAGTYDVSLTVTNDFGATDTKVISVAVAPAPPPYDPGGGPRTPIAGAPVADEVAVVETIAPESIVTSAKVGAKVKFGLAFGLSLPGGSDPATACSGTTSVVASSGKLRKVRASAALSAVADGCQLRFTMQLPKAYAGKKAKFAFAFAGNDSVAPFAFTRKLSVKSSR